MNTGIDLLPQFVHSTLFTLKLLNIIQCLLGINHQLFSQDLQAIMSPNYMDCFYLILTGIGTFGKVVLSQDTETGDYYALKVLALHDIIKMKQMEHIRNERDMLQAVRGHPFIVNLYAHHLL